MGAVLLVASGCHSVGDYFVDRAGDLSDMLQLAVGAPAIGLHVEATAVANVGLDHWRCYAPYGGTVGNFSERVPSEADFAGYSVLLFHAREYDTDPAGRDADDDALLDPAHAGFVTHLHELGRAFEDRPPEHLRLLHWLDIEVDAGAIIGVRARVSPAEMVDFLVGWFGLDLGADDLAGSSSPPNPSLREPL